MERTSSAISSTGVSSRSRSVQGRGPAGVAPFSASPLQAGSSQVTGRPWEWICHRWRRRSSAVIRTPLGWRYRARGRSAREVRRDTDVPPSKRHSSSIRGPKYSSVLHT